MVPTKIRRLSKRVNKPVVLQSWPKSTRSCVIAVGDIHNISCRVGYCEKDITKLELLVESLTNDLSTHPRRAHRVVSASSSLTSTAAAGGVIGRSWRTQRENRRPLPPSKFWRRLRNSSSKGILIRFKRPRRYQRAAARYARRCIDLVSLRARGGALPAPSRGSLWVYGPAATAITLCRGMWLRIGGVRGVRLLPDGTWQAKIVPEPGSSRTLILGHFQDQQQAARAFAAAAAVLRRSKPPRGRVWQLTGEEMDLLDGLHGRDRAAAHYRTRLGAVGKVARRACLPSVVPTPPLHPRCCGSSANRTRRLIQPHLPRRMQASPLLPWLLHLHSPPLPVELLLCTSEQLLCLRGLLPPTSPFYASHIDQPPVQADVVAFASLSLPESDEGDVGNNATTHPTVPSSPSSSSSSSSSSTSSPTAAGA
ncbi:unnamed protein product [Closterium sp. NIES-64]|nr:unnamed protein product [Closterium sp. NIES-64]